MIYSIDIPASDHKALMAYLRKGRVVNPELIGRVYTIEVDAELVTVEVMSSKPALKFDVFGETIVTQSPAVILDSGTFMIGIDNTYE